MKREILIAYNTIVRKEFVRFARIWIQTILPSVITIFLYITIFGNFIGDRIGEIQDFNYVDYIIPGLINKLHNVIISGTDPRKDGLALSY